MFCVCVQGRVCINKHFSKCSFPEICSKMSYLFSNFYFDTESLSMSNKNICSDSLIPLHGREGGKESCSSGVNPHCFLFFPHKWCFSKRSGVPAVWMCHCARWQQDLLGMWATIVSALCNHVEWWQWVSSLGCRQWPGRLVPRGHEDCSGSPEDVDPGC